ncbi:MAG: UpxY family transcription antiterminator [Saprospiraceae bacterium]|nr:UpxY family transcription antiterminator [Saprospiraceae bacterium]
MYQTSNGRPKRWYAIVTKYRNEKMIAKKLNAINHEAYVPLMKTVRQYTSRKKIHHLPLINCYVFVKIDLKDMVKVLEITNVFHFVKFGNEIAEISENEITILRRITEVDYPLEVIDHSVLSAGDQVEIIEGPLAGIRGTLIKNQNKKKFVVEFDKLEHKIAIEIEDKFLMKVAR